MTKEVAKEINEAFKSISELSKAPYYYECEDQIYNELKAKLIVEAEIELSKSKRLVKDSKWWKWKVFKMIIKKPLLLPISLRALYNSRHGNKHRIKHQN